MANKVKRNYYLSDQIDIKTKIASAINNGVIKPDETLPSYKKISEEYKCSMGAVMKAFQILLAENYIYKKGTHFYVVGPKKQEIKTAVVELSNPEKRPYSKKTELAQKKTTQKRQYRTGAAQKLEQSIIDAIESGKYKPGDPVSYRELKKNYGCKVISKAFTSLREKGYLEKEENCRNARNYVANIDREEVNTYVIKSGGRFFSKNFTFKTVLKGIHDAQVSITPTGKDEFEVCVKRAIR